MAKITIAPLEKPKTWIGPKFNSFLGYQEALAIMLTDVATAIRDNKIFPPSTIQLELGVDTDNNHYVSAILGYTQPL